MTHYPIQKAMIFAAGRGERMRPLTDDCPKPLLEVAGKPLIVWQIEKLAQAGIQEIIINHAWLGEKIEETLGNGQQWGVNIHYSAEQKALETAGGIAFALPLLETQAKPEIFLGVSADIFTDFDYASLHQHAQRLKHAQEPHLHLVMVPNPPFHPQGDYACIDGILSLNPKYPKLTFANIGLYDTRMFHHIPPKTCAKLAPYFEKAILQQRATGEIFTEQWENVGTPLQLHALNQKT